MYFERLDTIRWYAAIAVVFAHIFQIWTWQPRSVDLLPLGHGGVVVFFVLSGFLITRLLLQEPLDTPLVTSFKNFYMRRTLRIFPIYYLYLAVVFTFNIDGIRETGIYPWLYLTNIYIFNNDTWLNANSHLWSLSVEEQFYIVWPFLVLFLRNNMRGLCYLFSGVILFSVLVRVYLSLNGYSPSPQIAVFTFSCLDYLAIGSLLSLLQLRYGEAIKPFALPLLIGSVILYYLTYLLKAYFQWDVVFWAIGQMCIATAGAGIIIYAIYAPAKTGLFHNSVTMHLGKISYGIYLYHNVLVAHYATIAQAIGINPGDSIIIKIFLCLLFILIVTEVSFALVEKPLLGLKSRFR